MATGHTTFHHFLSRRSDPDGLADRRRRSPSSSGSAASTTGSTGRAAARRAPRTTPATARTRWKDYFRINTDHKVIGVQYTVTSFFFLLVGGLMAMLMRAQLAQPGAQFVDANTYNGLFSVHASILIFLFIIPVFAGLGNFVLPLMIGAPDMAFPRLNALSFWLLPVAGAMMLLSFLAPGGAFADGWTAYAPLSTNAPIGQTFFSLGVQFAGASSIMTALNFLVTIITMRAPGMSFFRMPLLVWANFATSLLVVIATPFIAASQFFVLLDRALGFNFFNAGQGRRRADVPARLLVLLAPGGLHHDAARLRDHQRNHRREVAQADLRLPHDGVLAAGDRRARLHRLGAPHVHLRDGRLDPHPDGDHDRASSPCRPASRSSRGWRRCGAGCCTSTRRCCSRSASSTTFTLGGISGVMLAMIPFDIHVSATLLHRRPHPLRAVRRLADDDLRRASTTGSRR